MHGPLKHSATPGFWQCFEKLDAVTQRRARESIERLKLDPRHPSVQLKRVGRFFSARVDDRHRALALLEAEGRLVWWWIGDHDDYERLIRRG